MSADGGSEMGQMPSMGGCDPSMRTWLVNHARRELLRHREREAWHQAAAAHWERVLRHVEAVVPDEANSNEHADSPLDRTLPIAIDSRRSASRFLTSAADMAGGVAVSASRAPHSYSYSPPPAHASSDGADKHSAASTPSSQSSNSSNSSIHSAAVAPSHPLAHSASEYQLPKLSFMGGDNSTVDALYSVSSKNASTDGRANDDALEQKQQQQQSRPEPQAGPPPRSSPPPPAHATAGDQQYMLPPPQPHDDEMRGSRLQHPTLTRPSILRSRELVPNEPGASVRSPRVRPATTKPRSFFKRFFRKPKMEVSAPYNIQRMSETYERNKTRNGGESPVPSRPTTPPRPSPPHRQGSFIESTLTSGPSTPTAAPAVVGPPRRMSLGQLARMGSTSNATTGPTANWPAQASNVRSPHSPEPGSLSTDPTQQQTHQLPQPHPQLHPHSITQHHQAFKVRITHQVSSSAPQSRATSPRSLASHVATDANLQFPAHPSGHASSSSRRDGPPPPPPPPPMPATQSAAGVAAALPHRGGSLTLPSFVTDSSKFRSPSSTDSSPRFVPRGNSSPSASPPPPPLPPQVLTHGEIGGSEARAQPTDAALADEPQQHPPAVASKRASWPPGPPPLPIGLLNSIAAPPSTSPSPSPPPPPPPFIATSAASSSSPSTSTSSATLSPGASPDITATTQRRIASQIQQMMGGQNTHATAQGQVGSEAAAHVLRRRQEQQHPQHQHTASTPTDDTAGVTGAVPPVPPPRPVRPPLHQSMWDKQAASKAPAAEEAHERLKQQRLPTRSTHRSSV